MTHRSCFAEFLVARRAELSPADVGLPGGGRRRTPGLRREEVAVRAGMSADYLARLEQGRDTNPSMAVVEALAAALLLNDAERSRFAWLALSGGVESRCPENGFDPDSLRVDPGVSAVLDALGAAPAFVLGPRLEILAHNASWAELADGLGLLDDEPNLARYVFLDPRARAVFPAWAEVAEQLTAQLGLALLARPFDQRLRELIAVLRKVPDFETRWQPHRLAADTAHGLRLEHPDRGTLSFTVQTLEAARDQRVVVWLPGADAARAPELRLLRGRAG
ncbi:helix-turn-helix transcriptional regulator [Nocardia thailandica]|uniref:Helix-turn-helix transcriptional regulator n=1 Tax=Nocardia thailandica TaxID=257275 RepID=A0ABW6PL38_9NOCA|nr:helix-turn-helix transcriptional regulator [Nocardia thailandica]